MTDGLTDGDRERLRELADADEPWADAIDAVLSALKEERNEGLA